jgi:hypothetical protein
MKIDWTIDGGSAGTGRVIHHATPRFTAQWTSGATELERIDGLCWTAEGGSDDDALHLFDIVWLDPAPDQAGFEKLMHNAATAIDEWITGRM